jgi:glucose/arabinose dehydrogenase
MLVVACGGGDAGRPPAPGASLEHVRLPEGFAIALYATGVEGARQLARADSGTIFAGSRVGRVYAIPDRDGDGRGDRVVTIARGLVEPHGVAFRDGALYVAERGRILRYDDIERALDRPAPPAVVATLPDEAWHGRKTLAFSPEGALHVAIGAPCNVCERDADGFGQIRRLEPSGAWTVVARGVRDSLGLAFHPATGDLWFTDNGRDHLGDERPPDELNRVTATGEHFGFPFCHGADVADPDLGAPDGCERATSPVQALGPHVAALGLAFYTGTMFPEAYRGQMFVAEHGSWNRSVPIGYRVTRVALRDGRAVAYEAFAEGWLSGSGEVVGRPVDVLVAGDGALLVSDDYAGVVYRITYRAGPAGLTGRPRDT